MYNWKYQQQKKEREKNKKFVLFLYVKYVLNTCGHFSLNNTTQRLQQLYEWNIDWLDSVLHRIGNISAI